MTNVMDSKKQILERIVLDHNMMSNFQLSLQAEVNTRYGVERLQALMQVEGLREGVTSMSVDLSGTDNQIECTLSVSLPQNKDRVFNAILDTESLSINGRTIESWEDINVAYNG